MDIIASLKALPGDVALYYKNLVTGKTICHNETLPLVAASVIKLPLMMEAYRQFEVGMLDPLDEVPLRDADRVPSCGVLTYLLDALPITLRDLVTLSIIVSDNTATNLLIDRVGAEHVNNMLEGMGLSITRLRRKMFDRESAARGVQNIVCAREIGMLLESLYDEAFINPDASQRMLSILSDQQLNGKIPFHFTEDIRIAHKTGEDGGTTHDVGIVYAKEPFILCFLSGNTDVPAAERVLQDIAFYLATSAQASEVPTADDKERT